VRVGRHPDPEILLFVVFLLLKQFKHFFKLPQERKRKMAIGQKQPRIILHPLKDPLLGSLILPLPQRDWHKFLILRPGIVLQLVIRVNPRRQYKNNRHVFIRVCEDRVQGECRRGYVVLGAALFLDDEGGHGGEDSVSPDCLYYDHLF
jgi:hypothetical protein